MDNCLDTPSAEGSAGKIKRRSRKACQHCHARKIRCNVAESGTPCSNCVDAAATCIIRRRKNQRAEAPLTDGSGLFEQTHTWHVAPTNNAWQTQSLPSTDTLPIEARAYLSPPAYSGDQSRWSDPAPELYWQASTVLQGPPSVNTNSSGSGNFDISHLIDLDDIFTFTGNSPAPMPQVQNDIAMSNAYMQPQMSAPLLPSSNIKGSPRSITPLVPQQYQLLAADHDYLCGQRCFELPPFSTFKHLMQLYFRMVHPNLPIIAEDEFWSLWNGDDFHLGAYSFLRVRAMVVHSMRSPRFLQMWTLRRNEMRGECKNTTLS